MSMRDNWACPDRGVTKGEGLFNPIPGSSYEFNDCPAYYLRTASMGLPAEHLIDGHTHPAHLVSEWAFEVENGARGVDTLSAKGRELVHLHLKERNERDVYDREKAREARRG